METTTSQLLVTENAPAGCEYIISEQAMEFLLQLHFRFNERRKHLLIERERVQEAIDNGWVPALPEETKQTREASWMVAPPKADLTDRRVEITGPVDRKMIINALNSGAKVFMADFEDSNSPSWENCIKGQNNLYDAVRKTISLETERKSYKLNDEVATLMVRARGWHLVERHITVDGEPMSASLVDFGLYFFHNAKFLLEHGSGPYFYLPKLEHYLEARLWNDVFVFTQEYIGIPQGSVRATVLIETITAAFQLEEILFELKDHSAGLNCGRWDYIFSIIKRFRNNPAMILPDRDQVGMTTPCMDAYVQRVIEACHKRGAHAMGGMAAQIPIKGDEEANKAAFKKVEADKLREVHKGHDGTWVAHPGLVKVAMEIFDEEMKAPNQFDKRIENLPPLETLLEVPTGTITELGVRKNIRVGILYIAAWISGNGAAAINHLMEDAATAEISRSQLWQWLHNQVRMEDGTVFTHEVYQQYYSEELLKLKVDNGYSNAWKPFVSDAARIFNKLVERPQFTDFLTLEAYPLI